MNCSVVRRPNLWNGSTILKEGQRGQADLYIVLSCYLSRKTISPTTAKYVFKSKTQNNESLRPLVDHDHSISAVVTDNRCCMSTTDNSRQIFQILELRQGHEFSTDDELFLQKLIATFLFYFKVLFGNAIIT